MPQIKISPVLFAILLTLVAMALSGCGDSKTGAGFNQSTGEHDEAGWLPSGHKQAALENLQLCAECHGQSFESGIAQVACNQCHLGGATSVHPLEWGNLPYAFHDDYVKSSGAASCATVYCHGANLLGVAESGPSCGINCHMAGTPQAPLKHAWIATTRGENIAGHVAYFNSNPRNYTTCRNNACHGGAGTTAPPPGVFLSGPACNSNGCHGSGNPLPPEI
jgi:hypothetical protein